MNHKSFTTANGDLVVRFTDSSGVIVMMFYSYNDKASSFLQFNNPQEVSDFISLINS